MKAVHEINKKEEITILWVTHYMDEVTEADRVLVMNHGKVAMQGTPKQVFAEAETAGISSCRAAGYGTGIGTETAGDGYSDGSDHSR